MYDGDRLPKCCDNHVCRAGLIVPEEEALSWQDSPGIRHSPDPHLQIRHRGPDVALGPFGDLAGDGDGSTPTPGEKGCESLVFWWL